MRRVFVLPISSVIVLIISLFMISSVYGGLIAGSDGYVNIVGNDPGNATGSFNVRIDYAIYDGTDAINDPLGLTSDLQIEFVLEHLGGDGETPILNFGRFTVFAPDVFSTVPFYTSINAVGTGKGPLDMYGLEDQDGTLDGMTLELPSGEYGANRAKFIFFDSLYGSLADFAEGNISKQLVLTVAPDDLPATVLLELNRTDTSPGVSGDVYIDLVPEPSSALFGIASLVYLRLRKRG